MRLKTFNTNLFILFAMLFSIFLMKHSFAAFDFYQKGKPGYEFTNFYFAKLIETGSTQNGKAFTNVYYTSEHYFQAKKFNCDGSRHLMLQILKILPPREVFNFAQKHADKTRPDWHGSGGNEGIKHSVMRDALRLKYTQNPELGCLLMATDGLELREDSPYDSTWGIGADGQGQNLLGKYLQELREDLLSGKIKIDWSHKNGAKVTKATKDYLKAQGLLGYFEYLKKNPGQPCTFKAYKKIAKANGQIGVVKLNPRYQAAIEPGFGKTLSLALYKRFLGLQKTPSVKITKTKAMLLCFATRTKAQQVAGLLTQMGLKNIMVKGRRVIVPNKQVSRLLTKVLKFERKFVVACKKHYKI